MTVGTRAKLAIVATTLLILVGCAETKVPEPPADFSMYLWGYGQEFTPRPAPADGADWRAAITGFPFPGAMVHEAIYGIVTCVDPARNCAERGLVRPGQVLAIWVISFVDSVVADGCPVWATVDAGSGAFINGTGPPCR